MEVNQYIAMPIKMRLEGEERDFPIFIIKGEFIVCKKKINKISNKIKKSSSNQYEVFADIFKVLSNHYEINGEELIKEAQPIKVPCCYVEYRDFMVYESIIFVFLCLYNLYQI